MIYTTTVFIFCVGNDYMEDNYNGVFNESVDKIKRNDRCWSDTNLTTDFNHNNFKDFEFDRLKCRNCGGIEFEILGEPSNYQTDAKCVKCGMYYIAHSG